MQLAGEDGSSLVNPALPSFLYLWQGQDPMQTGQVVQSIHKEHQVGALALLIVGCQQLLPDTLASVIVANVPVDAACCVLHIRNMPWQSQSMLLILQLSQNALQSWMASKDYADS